MRQVRLGLTAVPEQHSAGLGSHSPVGAVVEESHKLIGRLKLAIMGIVTLWQSVNTTNQSM